MTSGLGNKKILKKYESLNKINKGNKSHLLKCNKMYKNAKKLNNQKRPLNLMIVKIENKF